MIKICLTCFLLIILACSHAPKHGMGDRKTVCSGYKAMCPKDKGLTSDYKSIDECNEMCDKELNGSNPPTETCFFLACALETGLCDNEEKGDSTIVRCAVEKGWYTP